MSDPLARVKRAARTKRRAELDYRASLEAASKTHTYAEIGTAAGTSRQNVRQLLLNRKGHK
jgi:DNA-directed RNA polymerase sigma subunit (sigma70/sigma32)